MPATLRQPGSSCPRTLCRARQGRIARPFEVAHPACPGNVWEEEEEKDYRGRTQYRLVWRHYKNADKGGYVGPAGIVTHSSGMLGENHQDLFRLWVTWARTVWCSKSGVDPEIEPYTFLDTNGRPWRSTETSQSYTNMTTWLRGQMLHICTEAGVFTDVELKRLRTFGLQEAR